MDDTASLKSVSSNGTKRKRDKEEKFYAVRVGKEPGVYNQWHRCLEQVKGFKGGTCTLETVEDVRCRELTAPLSQIFLYIDRCGGFRCRRESSSDRS